MLSTTAAHEHVTDLGRRTLVALHAHPDDETIFTGGLLVRARVAGWRTIVVLLTSGDAGSSPGYDLADPATHRRAEATEACRRLGVDRLIVLPFADSGHRRGRNRPGTLAATHVVEVLEHLDEALEGEAPSAFTTYDQRGVYGHRDHVAVHCLGELLAHEGHPVYEATVDRHHLQALRDELVGRRALAPWRWPADLTANLGTTGAGSGSLLHLDLTPTELAAKIDALAAHGSQFTFAPEFMGIPPGAFDRLLAHEWYGRSGLTQATDFERLVAASPVPA